MVPRSNSYFYEGDKWFSRQTRHGKTCLMLSRSNFYFFEGWKWFLEKICLENSSPMPQRTCSRFFLQRGKWSPEKTCPGKICIMLPKTIANFFVVRSELLGRLFLRRTVQCCLKECPVFFDVRSDFQERIIQYYQSPKVWIRSWRKGCLIVS